MGLISELSLVEFQEQIQDPVSLAICRNMRSGGGFKEAFWPRKTGKVFPLRHKVVIPHITRFLIDPIEGVLVRAEALMRTRVFRAAHE